MAAAGPTQPDDARDLRVVLILTASRPEPEPAWQGDLERKLLPSGESRAMRSSLFPSLKIRSGRPWLVGGAAAAGLASFALLLGLAGAGPLSTEGDSAVEADDRCRHVSVPRVERVPRLVVESGKPVLRYERKAVQRRVKRCR